MSLLSKCDNPSRPVYLDHLVFVFARAAQHNFFHPHTTKDWGNADRYQKAVAAMGCGRDG